MGVCLALISRQLMSWNIGVTQWTLGGEWRVGVVMVIGLMEERGKSIIVIYVVSEWAAQCGVKYGVCCTLHCEVVRVVSVLISEFTVTKRGVICLKWVGYIDCGEEGVLMGQIHSSSIDEDKSSYLRSALRERGHRMGHTSREHTHEIGVVVVLRRIRRGWKMGGESVYGDIHGEEVLVRTRSRVLTQRWGGFEAEVRYRSRGTIVVYRSGPDTEDKSEWWTITQSNSMSTLVRDAMDMCESVEDMDRHEETACTVGRMHIELDVRGSHTHSMDSVMWGGVIWGYITPLRHMEIQYSMHRGVDTDNIVCGSDGNDLSTHIGMTLFRHGA
ncbi:hypothetical protein Tco_0115078 [Tanacetum coccineum]